MSLTNHSTNPRPQGQKLTRRRFLSAAPFVLVATTLAAVAALEAAPTNEPAINIPTQFSKLVDSLLALRAYITQGRPIDAVELIRLHFEATYAVDSLKDLLESLEFERKVLIPLVADRKTYDEASRINIEREGWDYEN
jgi:hypothetical protein